MPGPSRDGLRNANDANLARVAWSTDGKTLYAGGRYYVNIEGRQSFPVLAWADAGRGDRRTLPAGQNTVGDFLALPDGGLFVAAIDPMIELLGPDGEVRWAHHSPEAKFSGQDGKLAVSMDGAIVDFGRVLVLLDACRSAGLIGGNTNALSAADALKSALAANNVTVLTSSAADRPSREDDRWQHGAFTKVMLDALSSSADDIDTDRDGVI